MQTAAAALYVELCDVRDTTIIAIWKRIYSFLGTKDIMSCMLVCQSFRKELPSLVTSVHVAQMEEPFDQGQLEHLAQTFPNVKELDIHQEYSDHSPVLDFSRVKMLALQRLSLYCVPMASCCFTQKNTPQLHSLSCSNSSTFRAFDLDLPHLENIHMEYTQVDDSENFGPSLSKCPKLHMFNSYKLWGLSGTQHELHLPECVTFDVSRSDDLEALKLWAPKLPMLGLRACYSLEHVRIMDDENPAGTQPAPLTVNLINANIDPVSKRHLKQHPRVKAGAVWTKESQEWGGMMGELGLGMDDDGMPSDDLDSDDDQGFEGMEGFMAAMHGGFAAAGGAGNELQEMQDLMQLMMLAGGMGGMQGLMQQFMAGGPHDAFGFDEGNEEEDEDEEGSGSWQTDDEDAEDTGMEDEGADGGAAGGGGRAGGAGLPSCVIEEVE